MNVRLTTEQQKIVEDNHNLIYSYIKSNKLNKEEWYDLFAIELCKAVLIHNPDKGKLSTLFYTMCGNTLKKRYRYNSAVKRNDVEDLSLDYEYQSDDGIACTMYDKIGSDAEDDIISNLLLNDMLADKRFGKIVRLRYQGYTQEEISDITGLSQSYVSKILSHIKAKYLGGETK